jgi:muramoyltetrapeptide carboxypeptidase
MSIHGCHVTALGRSDAPTRDRLMSALTAPLASRRFGDLRTVTPGRASGPLFGGNLTLLHACAAAGRLALPPGAILFIEDVTELPYRIDRMLTTLAVGGFFDHLAGVVMGEFTACEPAGDGVTAISVLEERFRSLGVPVVDGFPAGHGRKNEHLVLGAPATIDARESSAEVTLG